MDNLQRQATWNTIEQARAEVAKGDFESVHLANYMLRDLDATKEAELSDLAWAIHNNYGCKNDVIGLIELLERHLLSYD